MNVSKAMRTVAVALLAVATCVGGMQAASAAPTVPLANDLAGLWKTVLQTPSDQNPFANPDNPDAITCWQLGGNIVAPFGPAPGGVLSCTVKRGTRIFVAGATYECSTPWEDDLRLPGETLQQCARRLDAQAAPTVTVDGQPVSMTEVATHVTRVALPDNNIFLSLDTEGQFAAHGWVTLLNPLKAGTHTIVGPGFSTTIIVQ
jgi:hypothetical protein